MTEEEWRAARTGKVTASRVADVVRKGKSGPSLTRARYMGELIAERLTGIPQDNGYTNAAMEHGISTEAEARAAYAFETGNDVQVAGMEFVPHPWIDGAGASPDSWVGAHGLAEIKCPATHTHLDYLITGKVPPDYVTQMQWQMACTGRRWCEFVSYDPRLPEHLRLFIKPVRRDDKRIAELESAVVDFIDGLEAKIDTLTRKEAA